MKYVVFGDNHDDADGLDRIPIIDATYLHLGDLCHSDLDSARRSIDKVRELGAHCVIGSHDRPAVDDDALRTWKERSEHVRSAGDEVAADRFLGFYTHGCQLRDGLEDEYLDFLRRLPETIELDGNGLKIVAVHDSLVDVGDGSRILTTESARANFESGDFDILFHGHTHTPSIFRCIEDGGAVEERFFTLNDSQATLERGSRYVLSPGSIAALRGYPRINRQSMLFDEGGRQVPSSSIVVFEYGSYSIYDADQRTF